MKGSGESAACMEGGVAQGINFFTIGTGGTLLRRAFGYYSTGGSCSLRRRRHYQAKPVQVRQYSLPTWYRQSPSVIGICLFVSITFDR